MELDPCSCGFSRIRHREAVKCEVRRVKSEKQNALSLSKGSMQEVGGTNVEERGTRFFIRWHAPAACPEVRGRRIHT
jgi:hypothetical protein